MAHSVVQDLMLQDMMDQLFEGNVPGVKAMLAVGASVDGSPQLRPLLWAAKTGDVLMVKCLIKHGADLNASAQNAANRTTTTESNSFFDGERALHIAIRFHRIPCIAQELLRAGADPNAARPNGVTPLLVATMVEGRGRGVGFVRELLEAGANPAVEDDDGTCVFSYPICYGEIDLINLLVSKIPRSLLSTPNVAGRTPLLLAVATGDVRIVSVLLSAGARQPKMRRCDRQRCEYCPLLFAVQQGYEDVVRLLTTKGGMKALGSSSSVLPKSIGFASMSGRRRILWLLLTVDGEDTARVWARCFDGRWSALDWASLFGRLGSVRVLLAAGADETAMEVEVGQLVDREGKLDKEALGRRKMEVAAVNREFGRASAFSARSWTWPFPRRFVVPPAGHYYYYDGAVKLVAATSAARKRAPSLFRVRVLRRRRRSKRFFVELVVRHTQKV